MYDSPNDFAIVFKMKMNILLETVNDQNVICSMKTPEFVREFQKPGLTQVRLEFLLVINYQVCEVLHT